MSPEDRGRIHACAAIIETRGRLDLALWLLSLIPPPCEHHSLNWGGTCIRCGEVVFTREEATP